MEETIEREREGGTIDASIGRGTIDALTIMLLFIAPLY